MCQAKIKGGKRCSSHHQGTSTLVHLVAMKSGKDILEVRKLFNDFKRESAYSAAPTQEELKGFYASIEQSIKLDNSLSLFEKQKLTKALNEAKKENDPNGPAYEAWLKLAAGVTLVGASFSLAGCSADTSASYITPNTNISQDVTPSKNTDDLNAVSGSASPSVGTLTNEYGTWQQATLEDSKTPYKPLTAYFPYGTDKAKLHHDVSYEEIVEGHKWAYEFAVSQGIDSIALDSSNGWNEWVKNEAPKFIHPDYIDTLTNPNNIADGRHDSYGIGVVMNNPNQLMENVVIYDNKRVQKLDMLTNYEIGFNEVNPRAFTVGGQLEVEYLGDDEKISIGAANNLRIKYPDDFGTLERYYEPALEDGKPTPVTLTYHFKYTIEKTSSGWKILGFENYYYYDIVR